MRTQSTIILIINKRIIIIGTVTKRQLDYRSYRGYVFRFALHVSRIKSCPRSYLMPRPTRTYATLVGKRRGIAISAMAIYSGRTSVLISANDRQNTRFDRLIIPRCRHDNRVEPLRLGQQRRSHAYYTPIISFYHSHYDVRIHSTLSIVTRWNIDGQSPRIDFPRDDFCETALKSPFYHRGTALPIRIFRREAKSSFTHKIDIRNVSTITCSIFFAILQSLNNFST